MTCAAWTSLGGAGDSINGVTIASDSQIDGFGAADDRQSVAAVGGIVRVFQVEGGGGLQVNGECAAGAVGINDVSNELTNVGRSGVRQAGRQAPIFQRLQTRA